MTNDIVYDSCINGYIPLIYKCKMDVATADPIDQIQKLYGQAESTVMHFHIVTFAIRVCVKYTTIKQNSCCD
jgi:hypothetical protein